VVLYLNEAERHRTRIILDQAIRKPPCTLSRNNCDCGTPGAWPRVKSWMADRWDKSAFKKGTGSHRFSAVSDHGI
jgi:hypothetical protein